jgi:hypothetical protein
LYELEAWYLISKMKRVIVKGKDQFKPRTGHEIPDGE